MSEIDMENKLRRVLFTFLEPNYEVRDEMYLEKLLVHISEGSSTAGEARTAVCEDWLQELVKVCMGRTLHSSVTAFTLQVVALIVKDPERFRYLYKEQILDKVIQLFKLKFLDNVGVRQAYVTLLSALVKHSEGCDYLITSELWKDAVQFCHEDTSIYVSREGMKFITEFLNFLLREDCGKVDAVLNLALEPLTSNSKKVIPALEMTVKILEAALFGSETCRLYGKLDRFNLDSLGWSILNNTEEKEILEKVSQLLTVLYFTSLQCQNKTSDVTYIQFNEFQSKLYNLLTVLITRRLIPVFLKVLVHSQFYWHKTAIEVPQESDRRPVVFEIQLIILQIVPVLSTVVNTKASENECMDSYISKIFDLTSESTQRLGYCGRDIITLLDNAPELAHMAVVHLMLLKDIMTRDQAVIVFQTMMYTLKDFLPNFNKYVFFGEGYEGYEDNFVIQNPELLSCVLEMVTSLIHCFNITWRDSVETICLFTMVILLLRNSHLTSKLAVQTLQLMLEVIQNFMPPNLALLVNTMEGSSIGQLGPVLYRRMHDTSWEVRDSALEVLRVVSSIAEDKFTAFQDHLLDNDLCSLCVVIVENDSESYVRASGLSCLGAMVRVSKYWSNSLASHDLPGKMIACLRKESEGIVRREAAALMKEMYELRKIPNSMLGEVFQTMADAAVGDLHWEVQINSLCFWSKVIEQELSDQGMIDGTFPSVTFSRVDRKIVTLTANEIKSRLGKALDRFSRLGCLQVLLATLEDCNLQVVQKSVEIVTSLYKLLSQYGVLAARSSLPDLISSNCLKKDQSDKPLPIYDTFAHEHSRLDKPSVSSRSNGDVQARLKASDEVIESIIQENDMRLLQEVYSNKVNDMECKEEAVHHRTVSADEFITALLQLNLTDVVAERTRWLGYCSDDLGSLLDDILASQIERESNAIDCY